MEGKGDKEREFILDSPALYNTANAYQVTRGMVAFTCYQTPLVIRL
jgi:hypothetical protein